MIKAYHHLRRCRVSRAGDPHHRSRDALRGDFDQVIAAIPAGDIDAEALCSEVLLLSELPSRFEALSADREELIKAVVRIG